MAAEEEEVHIEPVADVEEESSYKPPPEKSLEDMIKQDVDDESLRKYKETLLGNSATGAVVVGKCSGPHPWSPGGLFMAHRMAIASHIPVF